MTDYILQSQINNDQKFFDSANRGPVEDLFFPQKQNVTVNSAFRYRRIAPIGAVVAAGGGTAIFQLPSNGAIGDLSLEVVLNSCTGGYVASSGLNVPLRVRMLHGGQYLAQYDYSPVAQLCLSRMHQGATTRIYAMSGGASSASAASVYAPIFGPGSSWSHKEDEMPAPIPAFLAQQSIQVEVDYQTIALLLASGGSGGSYASINLIMCEHLLPSEEIKRISGLAEGFQIFAEDFNTIGSTVVNASTLTTLDLSGFTGSIKSLAFPTVSLANTGTAHQNVVNSAIDSWELDMDGTLIYNSLTQNETILYEMAFNKRRTWSDTIYGKAFEICFAKSAETDTYSGALNSNAFKKLTLQLTHTITTSATVKPVASRNVYIRFINGSFVRIL